MIRRWTVKLFAGTLALVRLACGSSLENDIDVAALTCEELPDAFEAFAVANRACTGDGDCVLVAGADGCECGPALGIAEGTALAGGALERALELLARFDSDEGERVRQQFWVCDTPLFQEVRCQEGRCTGVPSGYCNMQE